ncbi:MAG: YkgJ family cysteine cluster protein [Flavisolibacter sp.]
MANIRKGFQKKMLPYRSRFRRFLTRIEFHPPEGLDEMADAIEGEIWKETDCLSCSNCCRNMTPTYTYKDQKRISGHLGLSLSRFREKWLLKNRKGEWVNKSTPCQFLDLKTNLCGIYAVRPADCAEFPHLTKKPVTDYLHVHRQNVQHCPATFKMVEKLFARIKGGVTFEN